MSQKKPFYTLLVPQRNFSSMNFDDEFGDDFGLPVCLSSACLCLSSFQPTNAQHTAVDVDFDALEQPASVTPAVAESKTVDKATFSCSSAYHPICDVADCSQQKLERTLVQYFGHTTFRPGVTISLLPLFSLSLLDSLSSSAP